jgi:leucyl/phenylalanyl-tRNA---protein transferase
MNRRVVFPPVEEASEDGLVAIGGDLEIDTLQEAYRRGIFPWPVSIEFPLAWFSPDPRGVIFFDQIHLSQSFRKFLKKNTFEVSFNQSFKEVITECARMKRTGQPGTWITPAIIEGYLRLHQAGLAYSVEVRDGTELVAGLYGVCMGEFFSGESMFTKADNASKLALYSLMWQLERKGLRWLDTQMVTPVVEQFGGSYLPRPAFLKLLEGLDWTKKREDILNVTQL